MGSKVWSENSKRYGLKYQYGLKTQKILPCYSMYITCGIKILRCCRADKASIEELNYTEWSISEWTLKWGIN